MMLEAAAGGELEHIRVPFNEFMQPMAMGSIGYTGNGCKAYAFDPAGCNGGCNGSPTCGCSACQLPHKRGRRKNKLRPCKGKRDRYRKLLTRLTSQIEVDPYSFDVDAVQLPPSIAANEVVRSKLLAKVQMHAEQVRAGMLDGLPAEGAGPRAMAVRLEGLLGPQIAAAP